MIFFNLPQMKKLSALLLTVAMFSGCGKPDPLPEDTRLVVFPNPTTGSSASVRVSVSGPYTLEVFRPNGSRMISINDTGTDTHSVTVDRIGTYYLLLTAGNDKVTQTLIRR